MCNNQLLIIKYYVYATKISKLILNKILPGQRKIWLRLALKNGFKSLILNFSNTFYLSNSPCNLLSFELLNNSGIYYNNKNKIVYKIYIRQIFAQA